MTLTNATLQHSLHRFFIFIFIIIAATNVSIHSFLSPNYFHFVVGVDCFSIPSANAIIVKNSHFVGLNYYDMIIMLTSVAHLNKSFVLFFSHRQFRCKLSFSVVHWQKAGIYFKTDCPRTEMITKILIRILFHFSSYSTNAKLGEQFRFVHNFCIQH